MGIAWLNEYALELAWKEVEGKWMELDGVGDKWKKGRGGGKRQERKEERPYHDINQLWGLGLKSLKSVSEYDLAHWVLHISNQLQSLAMYSDMLHIGLHVLDSTDCAMLHCPLYLCPHMCCLFVYLFVCLPLFLGIMCCLPCLFISPSGLFLLLIGSGLTLSLTAPVV